MDKNVLITIGIVILCALSFGFGYYVGYHNSKDKFEEEYNTALNNVVRDTITLTDTIIKYKPEYKTKIEVKEHVDTIIKTIHDTDTIYSSISLPLVEKVYEDKDYRAVLKGIDIAPYPSLESIQIYQTTNTIIEEKTIVKRKKWGFNVSAGIGYGYDFVTKQPNPFVGVTFGYGYSF